MNIGGRAQIAKEMSPNGSSAPVSGASGTPDHPDGGATDPRPRRRCPGCSKAPQSVARPAPGAAMGHKPQIAVRDPFPGLPGARLARRRLLLLSGHLIDDLIVVATDE